MLCQFTGEANDTTLANYIPIKNVYPAGRLDKDSEGLLLLTDDGRLQHRISSPKHKLEKIYWVQIEGTPAASAINRLRTGVMLNDGIAIALRADAIDEPVSLWPRNPPIRKRNTVPTSWLRITLNEGRNRQVRRMTAAIGHPTLRLIRYAIGDWKLDNLPSGKYIEVTIE